MWENIPRAHVDSGIFSRTGEPTMENLMSSLPGTRLFRGTAAEGRWPAKMHHRRRRNPRRKANSLAELNQFSYPNKISDAVTTGFLSAFLLSALIIAFNLYYPAIPGPFMFDDFTLPYQRVAGEPLSEWISSSGVRPLLMFTYWVNHELSGDRPAGYRVLNVFIHAANTTLVFF